MIAFFVIIGRAAVGFVVGLRDPEYRTVAIAVLLLLAGGTNFYHVAEGWSWLDSVYFCVGALLTVGLGDLTPSTPVSKFFTIFYLITGVSLLGAFINLLAQKRSARLSTLAARRKRGGPEGDENDSAT